MIFYLGTHLPYWVRDERFVGHRLFLSIRTLRRSFPRGPALVDYAVDSGGFQELRLFGRWTVSPRAYLDELLSLRDGLGKFDWAAQQDWMCEPFIRQRTRKSVREHQRRTVDNYLALTAAEPDLPILPVLQGYHPDDYIDHFHQFRVAGIDLGRVPLVGVGSVCRRQGTAEAARIIETVASLGVRPHGFGFKSQGLRLCRFMLRSADSLAWSFAARYGPPLRGCRHGRRGTGNCANCPEYARLWGNRIVGDLIDARAFEPGNPWLFT